MDDDRAIGGLLRALVRREPAAAAPVGWVRRAGLAPLAFAHGRPEFRADHLVAGLRAEQQRGIAGEAVAALRAAAIPVALLKGISYAGWLYDDPAERPMSDVDLLVPPEAHAAAAAALAGQGYLHAGPPVQRSTRHHALTLKRPTLGSVDLHRAPLQLGRADIDFAGVWARAVPAPWVPGALRLDAVDEAVFHLMNLARHDLVALPLAYVDAGRLLRVVAPGAARERARGWRFGRVFDRVAEVVAHVLGEGPPPAWPLEARSELFRGVEPARPLQVARKLALLEDAGSLLGYAVAVADGWRHAAAAGLARRAAWRRA